MAIDDYICPETDFFILPNKSFYCVPIPIAHRQLGHFISSQEQDILYYACEKEIYCLKTGIRTRVHVATLPFVAQCIATGHGWLCVGGDKHGDFASIKIPTCSFSSMDGMHAMPSSLSRSQSPDRSQGSSPPPLIKKEKIGKEVVHSISIHKLPANENDKKDDVVAVLTNDDKTVRIYSLTHGMETSVLLLGFSVNHATISPDGDFMVAVGEYQQAYFFRRIKSSHLSSGTKKGDGGLQSTNTEWRNVSIVRLHIPAHSRISEYNTTAWSPSGSLCAVGSDCGYITIFDSEILKTCILGERAIVHIMRSSRPDIMAGPGAVRSIIFAPQPLDLLIWSEDQGRVCVADLRSGLCTQQILNLDTKEEGLRKINITDYDYAHRDLQVIMEDIEFRTQFLRVLSSAGNDAAINFVRDYLGGAASSPRDRRSNSESDCDNHQSAVTERAFLDCVLDAILAAIPIQEDRGRGASLRVSNIAQDQQDVPSELPPFRNVDVRNMTVSLPSLQSSEHNPTRQPVVIRRQPISSTSDGNNSELRSRNDNYRQPPVPLQNPDSNSPTITTVAPGLQTSDIAHNQRNSRAHTRERLVRDTPIYRALFHGRLPSSMPQLSTSNVNPNPEFGLRTTGLAISDDGRRLYAGCEEGIWEWEVNIGGRKSFGATMPR